MDSHKRILGIIYVVSGILLLFGMMVASMFFSYFIPWISESAGSEGQWVFDWIVPFFRVITFFVCLFIALPSIIAGWGLLTNKSWAMVLALIVGVLRLFSFPIGTLIGIYTIWVYAEDNRLNQKRAA